MILECMCNPPQRNRYNYGCVSVTLPLATAAFFLAAVAFASSNSALACASRSAAWRRSLAFSSQLYFGVELVDLLLELCLSIGLSLGVLRLQLRLVGLHGSGVLVIKLVLHF